MKIGVIGTGLMGKGIIQCLIESDIDVICFSRRKSIRKDMIQHFESLYKKEYCSEQCLEKIKSEVQYHCLNTELSKINSCNGIVETIVEDKKSKIELIKKLNNHVTEKQILFTNTSTIPISKLGSEYKYKKNVVGLHFFSPVPLMDIVEIVNGEGTSTEAVHSAMDLCKRLSKASYVVKDTPGFVFNRMLVPLVNEASQLYHSHYMGNPELIDNIFKHGMGLKFGPLKLADLTGVEVIFNSMNSIYEETGELKYLPCEGMERMVSRGDLGRKAKRGFYTY